MRGHAQQNLAFGQPLAHQTEIAVFEIAQPAMDEFARCRGGRAGEIALLAQQHAEAAAGRIAGETDAVDPAADDKKIDRLAHDNSASANSTKPAPARASVT